MHHRPPLSSTTSSVLHALALALFSITGGCVVEPADLEHDSFASLPCDPGDPVCSGLNTNYLELIKSSPLSESTSMANPEPNEWGADFLNLESPTGVSYVLEAVNGELTATNAFGGTISGAGLIDFKLLVRTPLATYPIYITSYDQVPTATNGTTQYISVYGMAYPSNVAQYEQNYGDFHGAPTLNELTHLCLNETDPTSAVIAIASDETYDEFTKNVSTGMDDWFSLACPGGALHKMLMMNYGPNANWNNTGHPAGVDERQALLRAITADYCGFGKSFTHPGTPVVWVDRDNTVIHDIASAGALEALWNEDGALCVHTPRLSNEFTYADIANNCLAQFNVSVPSCTSWHEFGDWKWKTYVYSGVTL